MPHLKTDYDMNQRNSALPLRNGKGPYVTPKLVGSSCSISSPITRTSAYPEPNGFGAGAPKDGIETPVKAFMNTNITPRSGSRRARVDSISSTPRRTPEGTPQRSRPISTVGSSSGTTGNGIPTTGLGLDGVRNLYATPPGSTISDTRTSPKNLRTASPERLRTGLHAPERDNRPRFFHANGASPGSAPFIESKQPRPLTTSNLNYMNGDDDRSERLSGLSGSPPIQDRTKFFHANGDVLDLDSPMMGRQTRKSPSHTSHVSQSSPRIAVQTNIKPIANRPPSPLKDQVKRKSSVNKAPPRTHLRLTSNGGSHTIEPTSSTVSSPLQSNVGRRSSVAHPESPRARHRRVGSEDPGDTNAARRLSLVRRKPTDDTVEESSDAKASSPQSPTSTVASQPPQSPSKPPSQSKVDQLNELAANARRERKVLDLEISNSSLLAINRTLEREMRKQNSELRRYRRLTRTGRLSIAPSNRSASNPFSVMTASDGFSSDIDEDDLPSLPPSDDEEDLDEQNTPATSESHASPKFRSARHARESTTTVHLDLAAHQALLQDSQKLNQSLKRCLTRTEDLITEGRKALTYKPHVEDLPESKKGGRVLPPDELPDELLTEQRKGLLSPVNEPVENPWDSVDRFLSLSPSPVGEFGEGALGLQGTEMDNEDGDGDSDTISDVDVTTHGDQKPHTPEPASPDIIANAKRGSLSGFLDVLGSTLAI